MRLALFTTTFYPTIGGAEKQLHLLATGLVERGHEVVVMAPYVPHKNNELKTNYILHRYPRIRSKRFGLRWHARFLEQWHQQHHFTLIHAHGAYPAAYMVKDFAQRHQLPLVVRAYGGDVLPGESIQQSWWLRRRLKKALASAQLLIAQNAELEKLLGELSRHPERVVRLPNGVNAEYYATEISPNSYRSEPPFAITLSTFYPKKGLNYLIRAWRQVNTELPHVRLKIAGHGPDEQALRDLATSLSLNSSIDWVGDVHEANKIALLQAAHVYVSSARREPFSNALLEAVAAGCRMIATATGGNIEILENTQSGQLVPVGNETALAEALIQAFRQPLLALNYTQRIQRIAPYSIDRMIDRYLELITSL